jgi:hypothetical protein
MSFRYKSAMISLASLVLIYGWYFGPLLVLRREGLHGAGTAPLVFTAGLVIVVQIIAHIVVAIFSRDRSQRLDERERGFDRKSTYVGYYVLVVGLFALMPLFAGAPERAALLNAIVLLMVVAESARQAVFLIQYHRAA